MAARLGECVGGQRQRQLVDGTGVDAAVSQLGGHVLGQEEEGEADVAGVGGFRISWQIPEYFGEILRRDPMIGFVPAHGKVAGEVDQSAAEADLLAQQRIRQQPERRVQIGQRDVDFLERLQATDQLRGDQADAPHDLGRLIGQQRPQLPQIADGGAEFLPGPALGSQRVCQT